MTVLEASGITRRYGGLTAVDHVDLIAVSGEVTALIGPNGAGKSTLFACLAGAEVPDAGRVLLDGADLAGRSAPQRARLGLGRTFQRLAVFGSLSVADNLLVGAENRAAGSLLRGLLGLDSRGRPHDLATVEEVLDRLGLQNVRDVPAATLPTGSQRLVELGRALCRGPRVLLLDEPASGLDTAETRELQRLLRRLADDGLAVLLVEHDMGLVLGTADRVYVMATGRVIATGTPEQVRADPAVRSAYLDRSA